MVKSATSRRAIALGIATGMRSLTPIAAISRQAQSHQFDIPAGSPLAVLRQRPVSLGLMAGAAGELVADLTLSLPPRTKPPVALFRLGMGCVVGLCVSADEHDASVAGAIAGALGALVGTYGGAGLRLFADRSGLPDAVVALAEDALLAGLLLTSLSSGRVR